MSTNNQVAIRDEIIIKHIKAGGLLESNAINLIISQNETYIITMVKNYNGNTEEAKDTFIEGVTEVIFHIKNDRFKGESSLKTYLYRICKLVWFQKYRSRKVGYFNQEFPENIKLSMQASLEFSDDGVFINRLLQSIGDKCKKVLSMWSASFNMTEIQEELGYANTQIAMNKKSKCLNKLKELIKNNPKLAQTLRELI